MFEQRLQQRLRFLVVAPAILLFLVVAVTITTARSPDMGVREQLFDSFARIHARPAEETPQVALIEIDAESLERVGPWPWPRTSVASLVDAAHSAGAKGVVVALPLDGEDPLSPEVIARFWQAYDNSGEAQRALALLPTSNAALSAASASTPTALSVGATPAPHTGWERSDTTLVDWATLSIQNGSGYIALPAAPVFATVDAGFEETALVAISSLPVDGDGKVRRTPLLWSLKEKPAPSASMAGLMLSGDMVRITPSQGRLLSGGLPPDALQIGEQFIPLDARSGTRAWLPQDVSVPTIPAWRVLSGGGNWTGPLADKYVFIGESVTPTSAISTPRGQMTPASFHALMTEQLTSGHVLNRPGWAGWLEALLALLFGAGAIAAAIFFKPSTAISISIGTSVIALVGAFLIFRSGGVLLDPLPVIAATIGGQLAILGAVISNILVRDDAVRGSFHGALPSSAMARLQAGSSTILRGVRREVTVLSCGLNMPQSVSKRFEGRPDDFVRFMASANDTFRRTILAHGGTVDYGEDGRLLGYWNVPEEVANPIEKACACALKLIDDVNALSDNMQTASFLGSLPDDTQDEGFSDSSLEIGLASASCFAGPVGRGARNRYAVIGEAVKLASTLRQRAHIYGPAIITDDVVFDALRHHYAFLDLDVIRLGEEAPIRTVYGLVGNPFLKASKAFRQLADVQRELVLSWRTKDLSATTIQLQRLRGIPGVTDAYVALYDRRLSESRAMGDDAPDPAEVLNL